VFLSYMVSAAGPVLHLPLPSFEGLAAGLLHLFERHGSVQLKRGRRMRGLVGSLPWGICGLRVLDFLFHFNLINVNERSESEGSVKLQYDLIPI